MPNTRQFISIAEAISLLKKTTNLPVLSITSWTKFCLINDISVLFKLLKERGARKGLVLQLSTRNDFDTGSLVRFISDYLQSAMAPEDCTIDLHICKINDYAKILAQAIQSKNCPSRLTLDLSNCGINKASLSHFLRAFESGNCAPYSTFIFDSNHDLQLEDIFNTTYDAYPIGLHLSFKHINLSLGSSRDCILKSLRRSNPADLSIDLHDGFHRPAILGIQYALNLSRELFQLINIVKECLTGILLTPIVDVLLTYVLTEPSIPSIASTFDDFCFKTYPASNPAEYPVAKWNPVSDILTDTICRRYLIENTRYMLGDTIEQRYLIERTNRILQNIFRIILDYDEPEYTDRYVNSLMRTATRHRFFSSTISPIVDVTKTIKKKFAGLINVEIYPAYSRLILGFESMPHAKLGKIFIDMAKIKARIDNTEIFIEMKTELLLFLNTFCKEKASSFPFIFPETLDTSRSCSMM